jgi:RNA polymerase sigma-70 factor (ECF subfamily)
MEASEFALVERAQAGDHEAYGALVERHSRAVFRLAYRITGQEQDAEDVVQDAFLRAYRQIGRFEARSSFGTWLYRIAANCAHDLLRARPRHASRPTPEDDGYEKPDVADGSAQANPERVLANREIHRRVRAGLDTLSDLERAAFILRHFEGLSIAEIGQSLGLGPSASKHSIFRAVQKMRRNVEPLMGTYR